MLNNSLLNDNNLGLIFYSLLAMNCDILIYQHLNYLGLLFFFYCNHLFSGGVANKFGLTPEQFGENLRDNYQRHETEQYPADPFDLAQDFICSQFSTK